MTLVIGPESPPLQADATGAIRVGNSRVLLELVIRAFEDGATPEVIVQRYSTVGLSDVYGAIHYYLRHPGEVAQYLADREPQARNVREQIEGRQGDMSGVRARLLSRRAP